MVNVNTIHNSLSPWLTEQICNIVIFSPNRRLEYSENSLYRFTAHNPTFPREVWNELISIPMAWHDGTAPYVEIEPFSQQWSQINRIPFRQGLEISYVNFLSPAAGTYVKCFYFLSPSSKARHGLAGQHWNWGFSNIVECFAITFWPCKCDECNKNRMIIVN